MASWSVEAYIEPSALGTWVLREYVQRAWAHCDRRCRMQMAWRRPWRAPRAGNATCPTDQSRGHSDCGPLLRPAPLRGRPRGGVRGRPCPPWRWAPLPPDPAEICPPFPPGRGGGRPGGGGLGTPARRRPSIARWWRSCEVCRRASIFSLTSWRTFSRTDMSASINSDKLRGGSEDHSQGCAAWRAAQADSRRATCATPARRQPRIMRRCFAESGGAD